MKIELHIDYTYIMKNHSDLLDILEKQQLNLEELKYTIEYTYNDKSTKELGRKLIVYDDDRLIYTSNDNFELPPYHMFISTLSQDEDIEFVLKWVVSDYLEIFFQNFASIKDIEGENVFEKFCRGIRKICKQVHMNPDSFDKFRLLLTHEKPI